ncbi:MAG: Asp-tRNA(Asn)/Glu-tRNA(Gln) amidotransferase subunit GatB [Desulfofustis sp. PB-SRB1]|jgi:aspartyl-tRNA(Asn)/glutamyl-tRNA(Gln) amidotransferase subunit B|nr:Asp-tRNA(Asn)/Glu-tRNA(Gln) amidotransferase subunit GatB [Desulfofustis sp. PB-SRB1]MBM1003646.1 Asp-tRNA(Asn)/Glu-tRNA(Gln) amidotransferase subunit GatB [Desulfofustis sp. PB-SRB1]HBH28791.1 Asp-tRNA(Asn)/Glu-tRNA(Gln) amidotransferase subunit GatB [Desulfofustis sp.]
MEFETVIGLEVHAQLRTATKIFCGCATTFGAPPNTNTCPVCLGLPGSLPVLNKMAVEYGIKVALAANATVNPLSQFARKNYFYPDLPKGYQTSQYDRPLVEHGRIDITVDNEVKTIGITRMHLEEDAGKLIHDEREPRSFVDLNRAGTPLLEIVSEPDLRSPAEAVDYLRKLHTMLRYLDVCDGNMQEGSFRCDANISLRPFGAAEFGVRTELKNMNSFRHVQAALEYEQRRQRDILLEGGTVIQQTMLWNPDKGITEPMRGKEDAHDYRYFPCPDLLEVQVDDSWVNTVRHTLPELPEARRNRFVDSYGLPPYDAALLTEARELADYFEQATATGAPAKKVANWVMTELLREVTAPALIADGAVSPEHLGTLVLLIEDGTISGKIGKSVFTEMISSGKDPRTIITEKGFSQISDEDELLKLVREIITASPDQVAQFKAGKSKVMGYFIGRLMQKTKGSANPKLANQLFTRELSAR